MNRLRVVALAIVGTLVAASTSDGAASGAVRDHDPPVGIIASVVVNPLQIEVITPPQVLRAGQPGRIRAAITNLAGHPVESAVARLHVAEPTMTVRSDPESSLGTLGPGATAQTGWMVCSTQPGTYVIVVSVEAELDGRRFEVFSAARTLEIVARPGRGAPQCR
jgi:hypothetical protein